MNEERQYGGGGGEEEDKESLGMDSFICSSFSSLVRFFDYLSVWVLSGCSSNCLFLPPSLSLFLHLSFLSFISRSRFAFLPLFFPLSREREGGWEGGRDHLTHFFSSSSSAAPPLGIVCLMAAMSLFMKYTLCRETREPPRSSLA